MLTLEDVSHNTNSRPNLFKEGEDDTNQVRSKFSLKISINQFCEIKYISQTIHRIKLKFYKEILDTWNYIVVNFQVIWSLGTYYFRGSELLDKPCQVCQITREQRV